MPQRPEREKSKHFLLLCLMSKPVYQFVLLEKSLFWRGYRPEAGWLYLYCILLILMLDMRLVKHFRSKNSAWFLHLRNCVLFLCWELWTYVEVTILPAISYVELYRFLCSSLKLFEGADWYGIVYPHSMSLHYIYKLGFTTHWETRIHLLHFLSY